MADPTPTEDVYRATQGENYAWEAGYAAGREAERREPVRVIAVVNWHRGRVHGITTDDATAQRWTKELIEQNGGPDQGAASMTVDVIRRGDTDA